MSDRRDGVGLRLAGRRDHERRDDHGDRPERGRPSPRGRRPASAGCRAGRRAAPAATRRSRAGRSTATASISPDATSGGAFHRRHASTRTNAATANSSIALTTAARISRRIRPYERLQLGRPAGEPDRDQREADPGDVRQQVAGVGDEREAVGGDPADELEHEHAERDEEHRCEPVPVRGGGRGVRVGHRRRQAPGAGRPRWAKNSARVLSLRRNRPSTAAVVITVPGLRTPRIAAHRWVASITTPTPCGLEPLHEEVGDLLGQPLLDLEPARVHLDDPRDLRQPDHAPVRDVGDVGVAEERQQVVLAQRVERDVPHDDHLRVVDLEHRAVDQPLRVDVVARGELRIHPVDAVGRREQALAVGVLADLRPGSRAPRPRSARWCDTGRSGVPPSSPISLSISSTSSRTWSGRPRASVAVAHPRPMVARGRSPATRAGPGRAIITGCRPAA